MILLYGVGQNEESHSGVQGIVSGAIFPHLFACCLCKHFYTHLTSLLFNSSESSLSFCVPGSVLIFSYPKYLAGQWKERLTICVSYLGTDEVLTPLKCERAWFALCLIYAEASRERFSSPHSIFQLLCFAALSQKTASEENIKTREIWTMLRLD